MHDVPLILTLTGGLSAALVLGYITQRLGLSPIVGYLVAGTLVGPHTPGFVADTTIAEQLAEIGVILLMFGVGLQFHIDELLAVRRVAVPGAIAQSVVATALGAVIARGFGWDWSAGIVFGMALPVASTVVLVIAATLAVVILGKPLVALLIVRLLRYPFKVALAVAIALAQIGEFSFILSSIGRDLGILTTAATNTLVAVSIVSIVVNPLLYRSIPRVERWASAHPRLWRLLNPSRGIGALDNAVMQGTTTTPEHRAVVVGYGPTGRTVTRLLRENGIEPTVIELNIETARQLRQKGIRAIYGDVTQRETLVAAGVSSAGHLILASAGMGNSAEVIRMARDLNPTIRVVARAAYLRDLPELKKAGADAVFSGEGEVALAFTEAILHELGATPEQIDRERNRAHTELFGESPDIDVSTSNAKHGAGAASS
jgi:voltage-gated potassium channel Kch